MSAKSNRKLNILQFNTYDQWGGAEKVAMQLHRAHLRAGHRACLAVKESFTSQEGIIPLGASHLAQSKSLALSFAGRSTESFLEESPKKSLKKSFWKSQIKNIKKKLSFLKPFLRSLPRWEGLHYALYGFFQAQGWRPRRAYAWQVLQGREIFDYPASRELLGKLSGISKVSKVSKVPRISGISGQADLIHCHNLHGAYFDLGLLASPQIKRKPVFLTLHDQWSFTGHCAYSFDCGRWEQGCGRCPHLDSYPPLLFDGTRQNLSFKKKIYQNSRLYVITPSQWLMDCVKKSILAPAIVEARVIPNGIDLSVFKPADQKKARAKLALPQEAFILLSTASGLRTNPYKDYATLKKAIVLASQKYSKLLLVALGASSQKEGRYKGKKAQAKPESFFRIARLGKASVFFVPFEREEEKIALFYQAADLYLHAAKADTFPFVVIEALACGLPVIATDVGGIAEQVQNDITGKLAPLGDSKSMAKEILGLASDSKKRESMSRQAVEQAKAHYSEKKMLEGYMDFYYSALKDAA